MAEKIQKKQEILFYSLFLLLLALIAWIYLNMHFSFQYLQRPISLSIKLFALTVFCISVPSFLILRSIFKNKNEYKKNNLIDLLVIPLLAISVVIITHSVKDSVDSYLVKKTYDNLNEFIVEREPNFIKNKEYNNFIEDKLANEPLSLKKYTLDLHNRDKDYIIQRTEIVGFGWNINKKLISVDKEKHFNLVLTSKNKSFDESITNEINLMLSDSIISIYEYEEFKTFIYNLPNNEYKELLSTL